MATTNDDLTWSEDVLTLEQLISSHTLPIIVRVEGGHYGNQGYRLISSGDIVKLEYFDLNTIIGYCYKGALHKRENASEENNIPYQKISFNKDTAEPIDVVVCLTKCDEVNIASTNIPPKPTPFDFRQPVPTYRTSLENKPTPPPVPPRGKVTNHSNTGLQGPKLPVRSENNEIALTLEEEYYNDVYGSSDEDLWDI